MADGHTLRGHRWHLTHHLIAKLRKHTRVTHGNTRPEPTEAHFERPMGGFGYRCGFVEDLQLVEHLQLGKLGDYSAVRLACGVV